MSFLSAARAVASSSSICAIPLVLAAAAALVFLVVGGAFSVGVGLGARHRGASTVDQLGGWSKALVGEQQQIDDVRRMLQEKVNALAMRVGQMNANVIRLGCARQALDPHGESE